MGSKLAPGKLPQSLIRELLRVGGLTLLSLLAAPAWGQDAEGLQQALRRAYNKGNLLTAISNANWREGVAMAATTLTTGATIDITVYLEQGLDYKIVGTGASERCILDLQLYNGEAEVVAEDIDNDATPYLEYLPKRSGPFTIRLYLRAADEASQGVAVALLENVGFTLPRTTFNYVSRQFFESAAALRDLDSALSLYVGEGAWPVIGLFSESGSHLQLDGLRLSDQQYLFGLSGQPGMPEAKLYLADSSGAVVAETAKATQFPTLEFVAKRANYSLRLELAKGTSANFLILGAFNK